MCLWFLLRRNRRKYFAGILLNCSSEISLLVLQVDEQIAAAFKLWSDVTDLTFTPRSYGRFNTIVDNDELLVLFLENIANQT